MLFSVEKFTTDEGELGNPWTQAVFFQRIPHTPSSQRDDSVAYTTHPKFGITDDNVAYTTHPNFTITDDNVAHTDVTHVHIRQ